MMRDWWLEVRIRYWRVLWLMSLYCRQSFFLDRMCALIKQRSPRQVAKMEREGKT